MASVHLCRSLVVLAATFSVAVSIPLESANGTRSTKRNESIKFVPDSKSNGAHVTRTNSRPIKVTDAPVFHFPDDLPTRPRINSVPAIEGVPPCAKGKTFCESIDNYPEEYLEKILPSKIRDIEGFFGGEKAEESDISQKIDPVEEVSLCPSKENEHSELKAAQGIDKKWYFIVNHGNYTQRVRTATCLNSTSECNKVSQSNVLDYPTECKQKFMTVRLVALDHGNIAPISFYLPSCCVCAKMVLGLRLKSGSMKRP